MSNFEAEQDDDQYSLNDEEEEYEDCTGSEAHSDDYYHFEEDPHLNFYRPLDYHPDSDDEDVAGAAEADAEVECLIDDLGPALALIFRSARAGINRTEILAHVEAHGFPMSPATLDRRLRTMKLSTGRPCLTPEQCARGAPIIFQCHRLGYSRALSVRTSAIAVARRWACTQCLSIRSSPVRAQLGCARWLAAHLMQVPYKCEWAGE